MVLQSNLAIRNFLVALKLFLNANCSLSLWSKWQIGHGKWFLNTNKFLIKPFLIAKFDYHGLQALILKRKSVHSNFLGACHWCQNNRHLARESNGQHQSKPHLSIYSSIETWTSWSRLLCLNWTHSWLRQCTVAGLDKCHSKIRNVLVIESECIFTYIYLYIFTLFENVFTS